MELAYRCHRCGAVFCPQHRLPENHECQGVKKESGALPLQRDESVPSGSKTKFRGLVQLLKKKAVIILIIFLVMTGIWAAIYLTASPAQRQAYQQFLTWASLIFGGMLSLGIVIVVVPTREWKVVGKTRTRTRGRYGRTSFEEESETNQYVSVERPPPHRISWKLIKWSLILGGIFTLFGFSYGIILQEIGYFSITLGGGFLGWGLGLSMTGGIWR
jgi:hypothetical protein